MNNQPSKNISRSGSASTPLSEPYNRNTMFVEPKNWFTNKLALLIISVIVIFAGFGGAGFATGMAGIAGALVWVVFAVRDINKFRAEAEASTDKVRRDYATKILLPAITRIGFHGHEGEIIPALMEVTKEGKGSWRGAAPKAKRNEFSRIYKAHITNDNLSVSYHLVSSIDGEDVELPDSVLAQRIKHGIGL
jgi:hypothetical protein